MKKSIVLNLSVLAIFLLSLMVLPASGKKWIVSVKNYSFVPYNLTHVRAGDTIVWQWVEGTHSTSSREIPTGAGTWNSPITAENPVFDYVPTVNGTYFYQCNEHASSGMNGTFVVSGASSTGETDTAPGLVVTPNPFRDNVNVQNINGNGEFRQLDILSLDGKIVKSVAVNFTQGNHSVMIPMGDLPKGVFLFKFTGESGVLATRRLIHQ